MGCTVRTHRRKYRLTRCVRSFSILTLFLHIIQNVLAVIDVNDVDAGKLFD